LYATLDNAAKKELYRFIKKRMWERTGGKTFLSFQKFANKNAIRQIANALMSQIFAPVTPLSLKADKSLGGGLARSANAAASTGAKPQSASRARAVTSAFFPCAPNSESSIESPASSTDSQRDSVTFTDDLYCNQELVTELRPIQYRLK
jgi:hypothetical protein